MKNLWTKKKLTAIILCVTMMFSITSGIFSAAFAEDGPLSFDSVESTTGSAITLESAGNGGGGHHQMVKPEKPEKPETSLAETATLFVGTEDDYVALKKHNANHPVDIERYDGETIYVLSATTAQSIYFDFSGHDKDFSLSDTDYADLTVRDKGFLGEMFGKWDAVVTLAANTPDGTELTLYAESSKNTSSVTILVVDALPEKSKWDTEVEINGKLFTSDTPMLVTETTADKQNAITDSLSFLQEDALQNDKKVHYYDIEATTGSAITVDGLVDVSEIPENYAASVVVLHLLDSAEAIAAAVENGFSIDYFESTDEVFAKEIAAAQAYCGESRVYYTYQGADVDESGSATFETDSYSTFIFVVDFVWNGMTYSLSGGGEVYLSELMLALGIGYDVSEVTDVYFSDDSLFEVTKLTDDWQIKSLQSFGDVVYLTITFEDGEKIIIQVNDPVIYNYAVGSDITNVPVLDTIKVTIDDVTNGDEFAEGKQYIVNTDIITKANVQAAGTTSTTATATHMVIYVEEGMSVRFEAGTVWPTDTSRPTHSSNGIWFWSWDSKYNYVVVETGASGKGTSFVITTPGTDGKTYYCNVALVVVEKSAPELLENVLPSINSELDSNYTIKNLPVTLYNYDGKAFNEYYNNKGGNYFAFSGSSMGVTSTENAGNRGWTGSGIQANGGGGVALMGILQNQLVNGLPVMSQGQKVDVFSTTSGNGKTVFEDVGFQFIYNEDTGYYAYNSALNHAQYNAAENEIQLYKQSLAPSDTPTGDSHGNAGFYPFEDINEAFTNTGYTEMDWGTWAQKLENDAFELIPAEYSTDIVQTSSTNPASTADVHYGLQMKADFYLPEGKKLNGQNMKYEFTGDDDLWVFIDGQLVLDIGGGHTYVSGSFDLTTGEVWVEKYTQLAAADGGSYDTRVQGTDLKYTDNFLTALADDQMHTIQIFYLERHAGVSNCRMHFNLPIVPAGSVSVTKNELVNQDGDKLSVTPDTTYTFQLYAANDDDDIVNATLSPLAGKAFIRQGSGIDASNEKGKTNDKGEFTLKPGQIAIFSEITRFTEIYVVEKNPEDGYQYSPDSNPSKVVIANSVVNNGEEKYIFDNSTKTAIMPLNKAITFTFTNTMQTQPLTIEKQVVNGTDGLIDSSQKFDFMLDFTKEIVEKGVGEIKANNSVNLTDGGTFQLGHAESVTIPRVPVNMTFTLKEVNPDSTNNSFDAPVFTYVTCTTDNQPNAFDTTYTWTVGNDSENKITVTNQQRFTLNIIKNIQGGANPDQNFVFNIKGVAGTHTDGYEAKVVVPVSQFQNGSAVVSINKLPVGQYVVTEDVDWSWRYELAEGETVNKNAGKSGDSFVYGVTYINKREITNWLDDEASAENVFKNGRVIDMLKEEEPEEKEGEQ